LVVRGDSWLAICCANLGLQVGFNVVNALQSLSPIPGGPGVQGTETQTTGVGVDNYFVAPPGPITAGSELHFTPTGKVTLSTTNIANTTATIEYLLTLKSPEFDKEPCFKAAYEIDQGNIIPTLINDGIPGAILMVPSPGVLTVDLSHAAQEVYTIPENIRFLDVTADVQVIQKCDRSARG
jgi:hypothetical protein